MGAFAEKADRTVLGRGDSLGTVSGATTAGTTADSDGDEPPIRLRGDELDLYMESHVELFRSIRQTVHSSLETTDDACAFAWLQFLREQPDREQNWQGWLFRVAQRQAWRLNALDWKERDHVDLDGTLQRRRQLLELLQRGIEADPLVVAVMRIGLDDELARRPRRPSAPVLRDHRANECGMRPVAPTRKRRSAPACG